VDLRIRRAIRKGARVWVVTSEPARLDRLAAGVIRYSAGHTGTIASALLHTVLSERLARGAYASAHASELAQRLQGLTTAEAAARAANTDAEALMALAREIASAKGAVILYDEMSTLEPTGATLPQDALDLALLTDNAGRPGAGVGPLFGDVNSLGARDMGTLPDLLPGYRPLSDMMARKAMGDAWGVTISEKPGLDYAAMTAGGVKALYVIGSDPLKHATPAGRDAFGRIEFLVVQELFLTETAKLASVVLPGVSYAEKDGTFTSLERRVQVVRQAMMELPGARADWRILLGVAQAVGLEWSYRGAADILAEIAANAPLYAGATRRGLGQSGAQWPLAADEKGAPVAGSPFLTWDMLAQGVAGGKPVAVVAGQRERA
jgi:predicted molibdopterin-dependent oxidoreductase YjgC